MIRSPNWIGDQVMAFPFFHFLRKGYPGARIVVACVPWVEAVQFRDLVDEVVVLPKPGKPSFWSRYQAIEKGAELLRSKGPFDLAISLPNSLSAAWSLFRSGARVRRGFDVDGRGLLLTEKLPWEAEKFRHRAESYVRLLPDGIRPESSVLEFWGVPPENELDQKIPGELEEFPAEKSWNNGPAAEVLPAPKGSYWVLAPGSVAESRRWPPEQFAALARKIADETGMTGLVVGGLSEVGVATELCKDPGLKLKDWTAQGSVASYWKVFRSAKFTVTNDSGLAHVASLCGSPVHMIWGAGDPKKTRPVGPGKVKITFNPVECWPCERNTCSQPPDRHLACLRGIQADNVFATIWGELTRGLKLEG